MWSSLAIGQGCVVRTLSLCRFELGLGTCVREQPLQLIAAAFSTFYLSVSLPVLVLEQLEYARWGWLPVPAPPASTSPAATPSSASTTSSPKPGGPGAAQRWWRRGGGVQCAGSDGSKQRRGDPDTGDATLPTHGGKAGGCPRGLGPPGSLPTSRAARKPPRLEMQN